MKFIQKKYNGIGLAAPQIGINRAIITVYNEAANEVVEFINPRYTGGTPQVDSNVNWDIEGCLSHPGVLGEVARYKQIEFAAQRLRDTKEQVFRAEGMIARIIQHEIDHLNGLLYLDLGPEVRNITFDEIGQGVLIEATKEFEEHGQQDFNIE